VLFVPPDQLPMGTDDDDVQPLLDDATALDLTDAVRDTLLLALPLRRVAPEAEDAEIPTSFGAPTDAEGNPVDDRWEALRRLRDDTWPRSPTDAEPVPRCGTSTHASHGQPQAQTLQDAHPHAPRPVQDRRPPDDPRVPELRQREAAPPRLPHLRALPRPPRRREGGLRLIRVEKADYV